jgi:RNA polymerase sigma factor (TIGR02999 family)
MDMVMNLEPPIDSDRVHLPGTASAHPRGEDVGEAIASAIAAAARGDAAARDLLFSLLYAELHAMAKRQLRRSGAAAHLGVTSLLHQTYVAMATRAGTASPVFPDRARFIGYAARVMRGVIVDHARERWTLKRGGQVERMAFVREISDPAVDHQGLSDISAALDHLAKVDPLLAQVVDLRFFCGFSTAEVAALMRVSERSVYRRWEQARVFLSQYLRGAVPQNPPHGSA